MRENKYKAWHEPSKTMFEWDDISINGRNNCVIHVTEGVFPTDRTDNSVALRQYTGLKDKVGKECYEGDIYKNGENGLIGVMSYQDSLGGYLLWADEKKDGQQYTYMPFHEMDNTNIEVIGNIYQDIHLLH